MLGCLGIDSNFFHRRRLVSHKGLDDHLISNGEGSVAFLALGKSQSLSLVTVGESFLEVPFYSYSYIHDFFPRTDWNYREYYAIPRDIFLY